MTYSEDPLVGEEIIRIALEHSGIEIHLRKMQIQIGCDFIILDAGDASTEYRIRDRDGSLKSLWILIGKKILSADFGETAIITLSDHSKLVIPPVTLGYRGVILGDVEGKFIMEEY